MKNKSLVVLLGIFFIGIFGFPTQAQEKTSQDRKIDARYTGELNRSDLVNSPYTNRWFEPRYDRYKLDKNAMGTIEKNINDFDIVMFMGAWCPDSHREVPRVFKILENSGYDMDKLKVYTLNHRMQSTEQFEKGLNITNVPTIIFYQDGQEVNRFVERPRQSIAKDIAKIVSGEEYKHYHLRK